MAIAIRSVTRIQDADDAPALGAGQSGYALTWNNATSAFVATALVTDHGGLAGLTPDDDHTQYALLAGRAGGQTLYGGDAANDDITIHGTSNATRTTSYVLLQPTDGNVGIGTTTPATRFHVSETVATSPRGIMSSQHSDGVDGARFHMRKSRGTQAVPTIITTGDMLGRLVASGYDGANYLEMGGIDIVSAGTIAATRIPTEIRFLTATDAAPSVLTQRMVIDKAGNVGIGTTTPGQKLTITSGSILLDNIVGYGLRAKRASDSVEQEVFYLSPSATGLKLQNATVLSCIGASAIQLLPNAASVNGVTVLGSGNVGIGTIAPASMLHVQVNSAVTNAVTNVVTIGHNTSGTAAAGFGTGLVWNLESSTTAAQSAAVIKALWYEATHASRKADLVLTAFDTAEREGLRIRGAGSAPAIGFYGVEPIERALLATGAGATVDNVITALQNLGLVKQS